MESDTSEVTRQCGVIGSDADEHLQYPQQQQQQQLQMHHNSMKCLQARPGQSGAVLQHSNHHQQLRKSNKPLMEKRRRERINNCLDQLKSILMEVSKKESSYYSKLEKADILEMTVKYLKNLKRQHLTATSSMNNADFDFDDSMGDSAEADEPMSKYVAGFNECAAEVNTYLATIDGRRSAANSTETSASSVVGSSSSSNIGRTMTTASLDHEVRSCLLEHLADSLTRTTASRQSASSPDTTTKTNTVSHRMQCGIVNERRPLQAFPVLLSQSHSDVVRPPIYSQSLDVVAATTGPSHALFPGSAPSLITDGSNTDSRFRPAEQPSPPSFHRQTELAMPTTADGKSLASLQVLPARLATGELVFLLAGGGSGGGGGACVDGQRAISGKLGQYSPTIGDWRSDKRKSQTPVSSTAPPTFGHGGNCDEPEINVRPYRLETSPADSVSSLCTLAKPLDFSFRSSSKHEQHRSLQPSAILDADANVDLNAQSAMDDKILADLANNNDPSLQSMWRPW